MEDLTLIEKIKNGDRTAFDLLFSRYHRQLCFFTYLQLNDKELAEELVSDVFLKVWVKRKTMKVRSNFRAYLYAITRNIIYDYRVLHRPLYEELTERHEQTLSNLENPERKLIYKELDHKIKGVIGKMPPQCRKIYLLNRHEGMKYREIAELMEISLRTVENQMGKALSILRGSLVYVFQLVAVILIVFHTVI